MTDTIQGRVPGARRAVRAYGGDTRSSGCTAAAGRPRGPPTSRPAATWCGATSPTTGCCAGTRPPARSGSSGTVRLRQRQHRRPAGPADHLRAGRPPRHPDRARRRHHRPRRPLPGQAAQQPQRRRGASRTARSGSPIPRYGITGDYEGAPAESEIGADHVYRLDPATGEVTHRRRRLRPPQRPGLLPRRVAALRRRHPQRHIAGVRRRTAAASRAAGCSRDRPGSTASGSTAPDGSGPPPSTALHCYDPDGTLIGKLLLPEAATNLTFGGIRRNNLFITNSAGDLYSIRVTFAGAR